MGKKFLAEVETDEYYNVEIKPLSKLDYISKDKVLKALGYEENGEEYKRIYNKEELILSLIRTINEECDRLEDIEDQIDNMRDNYWEDKIREVLEKERKKQKERTDISLALHSQYISLIDKIKKQLLEEK